MLRTTIYLQENIVLAVRRLSGVQKRPQAEIIRDAISEYVQRLEETTKRELPPGVGAYRSGRSDVSLRADELLKQSARKRR